MRKPFLKNLRYLHLIFTFWFIPDGGVIRTEWSGRKNECERNYTDHIKEFSVFHIHYDNTLCKNVFTRLIRVHKISLTLHEQLCLVMLRFERWFSHHRATLMIIWRMFIANMGTWAETIELADLREKKMRNATTVI